MAKDQPAESPQRIALVLSSGGARGLAHIGVIESLEESGYEITSIAGSSIGALIGAFYACGKLDVYKEWVLHLDRLDVFKLIDFTFSVSGFIKGERVFKALELLVPDIQIEEMRIPFTAVCTDIQQKKEVLFSSGSMYQAVKASIAIPTVIRPVMLEGRELIDGGVTNPVPVQHVKRTPGDMLVVSNVNGMIPYTRKVQNKEKEAEEAASYNQKIQAFLQRWNRLLPGSTEPVVKKLGFFDLVNDSIDLMQDKLTQLILEKHMPDLLVCVSRDAAGTFEFYKAGELIEAGKEAAKKAQQEKSRAAT